MAALLCASFARARALATISRALTLSPSSAARAHSTSSRALVATSSSAISTEDLFCARTYSPLPFVIERARGVDTWSPEGVHRLDFLAAFSAVNQGHCHPRILEALAAQASKVTLVSRAFHGTTLGPFARNLCEAFGYDRMVPANSGVEAVRGGRSRRAHSPRALTRAPSLPPPHSGRSR